jgi:hypothetical protein
MESWEITSLAEMIRRALRLEPEIYGAIQQAPQGVWLALLVVFLACLSESVGQSIVLFINRVRPRRFILALLLATFSRVGGFLLWTVSVWLITRYGFERDLPISAIASAVGLAYAPQLLAFFVLTPFLGNIFSILLSLWSMVAIIIAVRVGVELGFGQAVLVSGLGWVLIQVWQRTLGRPIYALGRWLERRAAGVPLEFTMQDIIKLRHRPRWLENLPHWKEIQLQAEQYVRAINRPPGEQPHDDLR